MIAKHKFSVRKYYDVIAVTTRLTEHQLINSVAQYNTSLVFYDIKLRNMRTLTFSWRILPVSFTVTLIYAEARWALVI